MKPLTRFVNKVLCGDAIRVIKQLPDKSIDLIVTDPPYGDNVTYGPRNTKIAGNEHPLISLQAMAESYRSLKLHTTAYMFCGPRHLDFVRQFLDRYTRYRLRETIIWDKVSMGVGPVFRKQYEYLLALEKGRPKYRNPRMLNLLHYQKVRDPQHPHAKPLDLIKLLILHSSAEGDVVLDPFFGTGTTGIAARQLDRKFIGIEIDAKYCQIAKARISQQMLAINPN